MTASSDLVARCEHCQCRYGYHEELCPGLIDDIVSRVTTGFRADVERIMGPEKDGDADKAALVDALEKMLQSCAIQPVGGGDGGTFCLNPPSGEAINLARATLAKHGGDK